MGRGLDRGDRVWTDGTGSGPMGPGPDERYRPLAAHGHNREDSEWTRSDRELMKRE